MVHHFQLFVAFGSLLLLLGGCGREVERTTAPNTSPEEVSGTRAFESPGDVSPNGAATTLPNAAAPAREVPFEQQDPAALREQVLRAVEQGRDDEAYTSVRRALRQAPKDPQIIFLMALLLADRHRFPEAIKILDDLARDVPSSQLPVLGQTAEWMVQFGQWSEAEERYRTLLAKLPESSQVHRDMAGLFLRQGRRSEAAVHLRKLCQLGNVTESELRSLLMLTHPFPGDATQESFDPVGELGRARSEMSQGNWESAMRILESIKSPNAQEVALLGRTYAQLQRSDSLDQWANTVAPLDPVSVNLADHWYSLGSHHASVGAHSRAVRCFCQTVLLDPTDARAYSLMGESLRKLDAIDASDAAIKRAKLIAHTQTIGSEMASNKNRDHGKMTELIDALYELQRPLEALSWRGVRLAYHRSNASLTDAQVQKTMSEIMAEKAQRTKSGDLRANREFVLCGVDVDSLEPLEPRDADTELQP